MSDFDYSSYPKPVAPKSLVEQVQGFNNLDLQNRQIKQADLTIDAQKFQNANTALTYMTRAMGSIGPNASKDQYAAVAQNAVKMGLVPQNMLSSYMERLQAAPTSKAFFDEFTNAAATHQQMSDYYLGQNQDMDAGDRTVPGLRSSPAMGGAFTPAGPPIFKQNPPNQLMNVSGQQSAIGPAGAPPPIPGQPGNMSTPRAPRSSLSAATQQAVPRPPAIQPAATGGSGDGPVFDPSNGNLTTPPFKGGLKAAVTQSSTAQPLTVTDRINAAYPNRIPTAPAPLYDEGRSMFTKDQESATQELTGLKPLLLAIPLIKQLTSSGPGTDLWTKAVAGLQSNGILSVQDSNDPTAIKQKINKYLAQFVGASPLAQRSDASQALTEASNPDLNTQILPALLDLAQTAAAQKRIVSARSKAFNGKDYENYGDFRSTFPAKMDERAFMIDTMTPSQKQDLFKEMNTLKNSNKQSDVAKYNRFRKSLETFDKTGVGGQ